MLNLFKILKFSTYINSQLIGNSIYNASWVGTWKIKPTKGTKNTIGTNLLPVLLIHIKALSFLVFNYLD